jgi:hypothetical protein
MSWRVVATAMSVVLLDTSALLIAIIALDLNPDKEGYEPWIPALAAPPAALLLVSGIAVARAAVGPQWSRVAAAIGMAGVAVFAIVLLQAPHFAGTVLPQRAFLSGVPLLLLIIVGPLAGLWFGFRVTPREGGSSLRNRRWCAAGIGAAGMLPLLGALVFLAVHGMQADVGPAVAFVAGLGVVAAVYLVVLVSP